MASPSLRIELFPTSIPTTLDFYTRVLNFTLLRHEPDSPDTGYAYISLGSIRIGLITKPASTYPSVAQNPADRAQFRTWPTGVEIVIEVDDVAGERERVVNAGWLLDSDLEVQEWGLRDFRIRDPDGYYLRITDRGRQDERGNLIRDGGRKGGD